MVGKPARESAELFVGKPARQSAKLFVVADGGSRGRRQGPRFASPREQGVLLHGAAETLSRWGREKERARARCIRNVTPSRVVC